MNPDPRALIHHNQLRAQPIRKPIKQASRARNNNRLQQRMPNLLVHIRQALLDDRLQRLRRSGLEWKWLVRIRERKLRLPDRLSDAEALGTEDAVEPVGELEGSGAADLHGVRIVQRAGLARPCLHDRLLEFLEDAVLGVSLPCLCGLTLVHGDGADDSLRGLVGVNGDLGLDEDVGGECDGWVLESVEGT